eukprot:COSAG04_NODE_121_length_24915_cov_61.932181_2_plen_277_part_00
MAEAKLAPVRPPHSARGGGTGQAAALRLQLTERGACRKNAGYGFEFELPPCVCGGGGGADKEQRAFTQPLLAVDRVTPQNLSLAAGYTLRYCCMSELALPASAPKSCCLQIERAAPCQLIRWLASAVSNEGRSSPLLALLPAVSWPWVPACGSLDPSRRAGENAQKGEKTGKKWARYGLKRVNKERTGGINCSGPRRDLREAMHERTGLDKSECGQVFAAAANGAGGGGGEHRSDLRSELGGRLRSFAKQAGRVCGSFLRIAASGTGATATASEAL